MRAVAVKLLVLFISFTTVLLTQLSCAQNAKESLLL